MTWSRSLVSCVTINVALQVASVAPASLVLRGSVRLIAVVATRIKPFTVKEFAAISSENWQNVRFELRKHHSKRLQQRRFRRDSDSYLLGLEAKFLQLALPA